MPLYEFKCYKCDKIVERLCSFDKAVEGIKCFDCGSVMEKQQSMSSFILKGNNWAKDNYGLKKDNKKTT